MYLCYRDKGCGGSAAGCDAVNNSRCPYGPMPPQKDRTPEEVAHARVHHPEHYTRGIECWDYIASHKLGFLEGNVIKYVTRYQLKNGLEDLLKARQYLERLIKEHGGIPLTEF